jgi:hypothetical protein
MNLDMFQFLAGERFGRSRPGHRAAKRNSPSFCRCFAKHRVLQEAASMPSTRVRLRVRPTPSACSPVRAAKR